MKGGGQGSIEAIGVNDVIERLRFYITNIGTTCYSVWQSQNLKFPYTGNDKEEAIATLAANVTAMQPMAGTTVYTVKFHAEPEPDGYVSNKTPVVGSFNFRLNDFVPYTQIAGTVPQTGIHPEILELLRQNNERMRMIEEALYSDSEKEEEEDEPLTQEERIAGTIRGITNAINETPVLSHLLDDGRLLLRGLLIKMNLIEKNNTMPTQTQTHPDQHGYNEQPTDTEKLKYALGILLPILPELPDMLVTLANMSQNDQPLYHSIVNKLKAAI